MTTLLLRLAGPLQAWGDSSRFNVRATRREPTKSGIVGMLAAATGRRRTDPIEDLANLRFGCRVDQRGRIVRDFQTEIDWRTDKSKALTDRHYLADARFLVGVEGEDSLLAGLAEALEAPVFPVYLGRRSCPPSGRIVVGCRDGDVETVLREEPWTAAQWYRREQPTRVDLPLSVDATDGERVDELIRDHPISFDPRDRRHELRPVRHDWVQVENAVGRRSDSHDPFALL